MPTYPGGVQVAHGDGSVRALLPGGRVPLAALAMALRGAGRVTRACTLGTQGPELRAALAQLRALGLVTGLPRPRSAGEPTPLLLLVDDAGATGPSAGGLLLLSPSSRATTALLLPAVQSARESARRIMPTVTFEVGLVLRAPGSGTAAGGEQMALNFEHIRD